MSDSNTPTDPPRQNWHPYLRTPESTVHRRISSLVLELMQARGPDEERLATLLGLSATSILTNRLNLGRFVHEFTWQTCEVVALAAIYQIPTDALLQEGEERRQLRAQLARELRAVPDPR